MASLRDARHANVWEETAVAAPAVPALEGAHRAHVLIVGAGYLGLSAALHLAEAGVDVVVVDSHEPGWGASGRNGGQVIPGLKHDPGELEAMFGRERGERIWRFAGGAADVVFDLVARHRLDCHVRRAPWIQGIHSEKAAARARRRVADWKRRGAPVEYLDRAATAAISGTDIYIGAFADARAGALQPLSYVRELARAAIAAGARVYRGARVSTLQWEGNGWRAATAAGGDIRARIVLVATNAYADRLVPDLARSIVALNSLQIDEAVTGLVDTIVGDALDFWGLSGRTRRRPRPVCQRRRVQIIEDAKALLAREYWTDLSLADLARKLHCSAAHLSRMFHAATGFRLCEYRQELRLRKGLFLLEESGLEIGDVAVQVGFASHSHFTSAFHRRFGINPSEFLKWKSRKLIRAMAAC